MASGSSREGAADGGGGEKKVPADSRSVSG